MRSGCAAQFGFAVYSEDARSNSRIEAATFDVVMSSSDYVGAYAVRRALDAGNVQRVAAEHPIMWNIRACFNGGLCRS